MSRNLFAQALLIVSTIGVLEPAIAGEAALRSAFTGAVKDLSRGIDADQSPNFQALLGELPQDAGGLYVVEGDIAVTRDELEEYLLSFASGATPTGANPELLVNLHEGETDFYETPEERILNYTVDRASFADAARFDEVVALMDGATADWEQTCPECGIDFRRQDAEAITNDTSFVVEFRNVGGAFIARAFFPHHQGTRRRLTIDPSFFTTGFDKQGVLRHELGHVLGYRHGHIGGIPGCFNEGGEWRPLTEYDPKSVMHYFCGGGGTLALAISDIDREGHRRLYVPAPAPIEQ